MKIIEVRDGIIKFETDGSLCLSSFIKVDGIEKSYIAQLIQEKPEENIAFAKILFLYDGTLHSYDKTVPSEDAVITEFTSNILENAIKASSPVIVGRTLDDRYNIAVDLSIFNKKMLVCVNDNKNKNVIIRNLVKQFNSVDDNVIVIDALGNIDAKKYIAGIDFKLPLDKSTLKFIFEECLNDATSDSRDLIVNIFKDLAEYIETVKFVPFDILKNIVTEMVDKSHIFKLLVLKNRLTKLDRLGYFAKTEQEVENIKKILNSRCAIIDFSKLDSVFENRFITYIYEKINSEKTRVILELSNALSKKSLKNIFENDTNTVFVSHSKFKYIADIKTLFDNFIVFPSEENNRLFNIYATFLRAMKNNSYLLVGEGTNYIPFVSLSKLITETGKSETQEKEEDNIKGLEELIEEAPDNSEEACNDNLTPTDNNIESGESTVISSESEIIQNEEEIAEDGQFENFVFEGIIQEPQTPSKEEILATIDEKSSNTISDITNNLEAPKAVNMFEEENDSETVEFEEENQEDSDLNMEIDGLSTVEPVEEVDISDETEINDISNNDEIPEIISTNSDDESVNIEENDDNQLINDIMEETTQSDELIIPENDSQDVKPELETDEQELSIDIGDEIDLDLDEAEPEEQTENTQPQEEIVYPGENNVEVLGLNDDDFSDEILELNPDETNDDDILIDMTDDSDENLDEEIKREVDKVYTTRKDEDFSDSDLDFIDELNNEDNTILEPENTDNDSILEELNDDSGILEEYKPDTDNTSKESNEILETRNTSTPIVPVYDASIPEEDMVESDPIGQGDSVTHVTFGNGVVEKLVKYGSKTLFMINFDTDGRKLLDPLLTEIKKIG